MYRYRPDLLIFDIWHAPLFRTFFEGMSTFFLSVASCKWKNAGFTNRIK